MRYKHFVLALAACAVLALLPTPTRADSLTFTFTPAAYAATAGSVVNLTGTFTNDYRFRPTAIPVVSPLTL
jgi:hypothetical protein